ncbi:unnamed protein product [Rhizophagus irregularis]|nr:unnamed protein product [Rhizophagus irregularis]
MQDRGQILQVPELTGPGPNYTFGIWQRFWVLAIIWDFDKGLGFRQQFGILATVWDFSNENNVQDDKSSWFKNFKKIVKEVEVLVDMAAKAHQAAVDNDKKRRLLSNANLVDIADKKKYLKR